MEQKTPKFRLRLNLFDGIVLVLALAVGAFLLWNALKPAPAANQPSASTSTVRYTVRFQKWQEGTGALVQVGDKLADNRKNYELGTVVATEVVPSEFFLLDHESREYVLTTIPGYEDVLVTLEAPCTLNDKDLSVGGGYSLKVGASTFIRGNGYFATGPIISIEREGLK